MYTAFLIFFAAAARAGLISTGLFHMQIRYPVELTLDEYLEQKGWEQVELDHCPFHPEGGCGFAKHGTYPRKFRSIA